MAPKPHPKLPFNFTAIKCINRVGKAPHTTPFLPSHPRAHRIHALQLRPSAFYLLGTSMHAGGVPRCALDDPGTTHRRPVFACARTGSSAGFDRGHVRPDEGLFRRFNPGGSRTRGDLGSRGQRITALPPFCPGLSPAHPGKTAQRERTHRVSRPGAPGGRARLPGDAEAPAEPGRSAWVHSKMMSHHELGVSPVGM